jgi:hypothetical protein
LSYNDICLHYSHGHRDFFHVTTPRGRLAPCPSSRPLETSYRTLARSSKIEGTKHCGITFLLIDLKTLGVKVRPMFTSRAKVSSAKCSSWYKKRKYVSAVSPGLIPN